MRTGRYGSQHRRHERRPARARRLWRRRRRRWRPGGHGGSGEKQVNIYGTDGNMGSALGEQFSDEGALAGMQGTTPLTDLCDDFKDRLLDGSTPTSASTYNYAGETYDAVVLIALAAQAGRHQRRHRLRAVRQRAHLRWRQVQGLRVLPGDPRGRWQRRLRRRLRSAELHRRRASRRWPASASCSSATTTRSTTTLTEYLVAGDEANAATDEGPAPAAPAGAHGRAADHRHAAAADRHPRLPRPARGRRCPARHPGHQRGRRRAGPAGPARRGRLG